MSIPTYVVCVRLRTCWRTNCPSLIADGQDLEYALKSHHRYVIGSKVWDLWLFTNIKLTTGLGQKAGPRLREFWRQGQTEVVSNSRNKIHLTWGRALYKGSSPNEPPPKLCWMSDKIWSDSFTFWSQRSPDDESIFDIAFTRVSTHWGP